MCGDRWMLGGAVEADDGATERLKSEGVRWPPGRVSSPSSPDFAAAQEGGCGGKHRARGGHRGMRPVARAAVTVSSAQGAVIGGRDLSWDAGERRRSHGVA